jgi:hypothetical protein
VTERRHRELGSVRKDEADLVHEFVETFDAVEVDDDAGDGEDGEAA